MRKIQCEGCAVRLQSILQDLPTGSLCNFREYGVTSLYKRRQVIFHEGTPAAGLHILCHGAVKLYQADRFGREHILGIAVPGEVLGELPADPNAPYSVSAEALTDSQLCYLPRDRLVSYIQSEPMVGIRLVESFSRAVAAARKKVRDLALKRAEGRLADLLIELAKAAREPGHEGQARLTLGYSRREIAEMIGVSTETAIRLLGRLKDKGVIATNHRDLVIVDLEELVRIANHDEGGDEGGIRE